MRRVPSRFVLAAATLTLLLGVMTAYLLLPHLESQDYAGKLERLKLPTLPGPIPTHYSAGYKERAEGLQSLIRDMFALYEPRFGLAADLRLAVLTKSDWQSITRRLPYGVPAVGGDPPVAGIPATPDGAIHQTALVIRPRLSRSLLERIAAEGVSYERAAAVFVDLIGLHELGHHLAFQYGIELPSRWLHELTATYFSYGFLAEKRPDLQRIWDLVATGAYLEGANPAYRSLSDFEERYFGVGVETYCWYQAMFNRRVSEIWPQRGAAFLADLRREFPARREGEELRAPEADVIDRLEKIAPGFRVWAARFR